jgi:hypothetical protein
LVSFLIPANYNKRLVPFISLYRDLFNAFVGLNLLQSAFTRWCLMEDSLTKLGVRMDR